MDGATEILGIPIGWSTVLLVTLGTTLLFGAFSLVVARMAQFQGAARSYAIFGGFFALTVLGSNLSEFLGHYYVVNPIDSVEQVKPSTWTAFGILYTPFGLLAMGWVLGTWGLLRHHGVAKPWRSPVAWSIVAASVAGYQFQGFGVQEFPGYSYVLTVISGVAFPFAVGWMAAGAVLLAQAWVRDRDRSQAILAIALAAYPILFGSYLFFMNPTDTLHNRGLGMYGILGFVLAAGSWWWAYEQTRDTTAKRIAIMAALLFGLGGFVGMWWPQLRIEWFARLFEIALIAWAIMRHQHLGLDLKVQWGVSKSFVAGAFVAVFFMVSEGAQAFLGDRFQSEYWGIAGAGLLVLGISPLQRVADRFAQSAVPATRPDTEATYREAVRMALADGRLNAKEEEMLADLADRLGLSVKAALAVQREVRG